MRSVFSTRHTAAARAAAGWRFLFAPAWVFALVYAQAISKSLSPSHVGFSVPRRTSRWRMDLGALQVLPAKLPCRAPRVEPLRENSVWDGEKRQQLPLTESFQLSIISNLAPGTYLKSLMRPTSFGTARLVFYIFHDQENVVKTWWWISTVFTSLVNSVISFVAQTFLLNEIGAWFQLSLSRLAIQ